MEPDEELPVTMERRTRRRRLHPAALVVLLVGIAASVAGALVNRADVEQSKQLALDQVTDDLADDTGQLMASAQNAATEIRGAVTATEANPLDVERTMQTALDDPLLAALIVLQADASGLRQYADAGNSRIIDLTGDPEALLATIDALAATEPGELELIGHDVVEDTTVAGFALKAPTTSADWVVFVELAIPTYLFEEAAEDLDVTDFALYLGSEETASDLVVASTDRLPLGGRREQRTIPVGDQDATLVVAATGPLLTTREEISPWLILLGGLLATALLTPLVHAVLTRREEVRKLSEENEELDQALATSQRIAAELRASEQRFRSVLTSSPDIIVSMDSDGTAVQVLNRPHFLGYEPEEVESPQHFLDLVHDEDWPAAEEGFNNLRWSEPGTITEFEFRMKAKDGSWEWLHVRGGAVRQEGEDRYILAVMTTITEQKREERRRAELEARLMQSQRLEAVGQLASGVAHDFNNILAAIISGAELALDEVHEGQAHEDLEEIRYTARRGSELSRQLLLFSRRGESTNPELLDLNELVSGMHRMLDRTIGVGLKLRSTLAAESPLVIADATELERVIMNLVLNARDAMPDGGVITLETERVELDEEFTALRTGLEPGEYVRLAVRDTGSGMPAEIAARAFEPFFTTKDVGKGTGLGLATVYGIVQRSEGYVELESEIGAGTAVTIYLPAPRDQDEGPDTDEEAIDLRGRGERVLLVEDDPAIRLSTKRLLERRGYEVDVAEDGPAAGALAATKRFDLLLTDVLMPGGMSGKDVSEVLRKRQPHLAVVYMTGHSADQLERVGISPVEPYIARKPFTEERVLEMVRRALDDTIGSIVSVTPDGTTVDLTESPS